MKKYALIVAGGSGTRMGADIPKQFLLLNNKPILMHSLACFYNYDSLIDLVLVLPEFQFQYWKDLCQAHNFTIPHRLVAGGGSRFQSVRNGLDAIEDTEGVVFIHDGVRPFVSEQTIALCEERALLRGSAIPVMPAIESLRRLNSTGGSEHVDRANYVMVQTPQTFNIHKIKAAFTQEERATFTDDASVFEAYGEKVELVAGNEANIKITRPTDLLVGEAFMNRKRGED